MYSKIHKWLSILAFGSFVISVAVSASTRSFSSILLHSRTIDTNRVSKEEYFQALGDDSPNSSDDDIGMHLVQLKSPLGPSQLKRFEKLYGISTLFYIPENAYIIRCTQSIAMGVAKSNEVHWIGPLLPKDKFSPDVQFPQEENPWQLSLHCIIMMHVVEDGRQLAKSIKEAFPFHIDDFSATPISKDRIEVCFKATSMLYATILDALSRRNEAIYLYRVPLRQKLNKFADRIIRNGNQRAALTPSAMSELSGAGQIIGCGDTGLDPDHCFFHDPTRPIPLVHYSGSDIPDDSSDPFHRKIVQYVSYTEQLVILDGHGTHVAGTLVGKPWDYNPDKLRDIDGYSGIAMDAKLAFFDISGKDVSNGVNIPKVLDSSYFGWAYAAGARIHSNSWGSPTVLYNVDAYDVDKYAWEHKDFLPVFAAGNNGTDGDKHVSSPGNAKNAISVGSSISPLQSFQEVFCEHGYSPNYFVCKQAQSEFQHLTENDIAYFSSMGPTVDGRIKPDVVAPGYYIYSARNAPDQAESCELEMSELLLAHAGTSMSAPVLASTLALARQYFVDGYYPTGDKKTGVQLHPSAALLKAVAIAGAVSLTGYRDYGSNLVHNYRPLTPAPTFVQGFGRTQLDNVLKFNGVSRFDMIIAGYKDGEDFKDPFFEDLGQFHEYKVCILGNSKKYRPRFTLVWTDYPAVPLSAVAIVNDLDLQVQYELRNSNVTQLSEPIHPNRSDHPDRVNTVERVELTEEPLSDVVIVRVSAASIHHAPQSYSLLITGQVAMVDMQESCRKVSHRKFAVDPLDADNIDNSKIATWHDRILSNMFLFGVLASTLTIVFMLMCFDICLRLKAKRQTKSRNEKSAPNEAMVLAGRNLSFP